MYLVLQVLLSSNQECPHSLGTWTHGGPLKGPQQMAMASVCRGIDIIRSERFGVTQQALRKSAKGNEEKEEIEQGGIYGIEGEMSCLLFFSYLLL